MESNKHDKLNELWQQGSDAYKAGKLAEAEAYWNQAFALDPEFFPVLESLTALYKEHGKQLNSPEYRRFMRMMHTGTLWMAKILLISLLVMLVVGYVIFLFRISTI
jgi:Tfp pilus assembly protein PilF